MNDLLLIVKYKNKFETESSAKTIGMVFEVEKCAMIIKNKGKKKTTETELHNQNKIFAKKKSINTNEYKKETGLH